MNFNKTNEDYIEMDVEELLKQNALLDDLFQYEDIKNRRLFYNDIIEPVGVYKIVRHILNYNKQDWGLPVASREPIKLYLSTLGGDAESGFSLIDAIISSKTPVHIINIGDSYSMGFLISLAGHKRYAFKNTRFLLHDGSEYIYDSASKANDRKKFTTELDKRIKDLVVGRTKITSQKYSKNRRREWYMFADEAKELGVVDYIIGEDVDIDEIL